MRRKDSVHISEAIRAFIHEYGLEKPLDECSAVAAWNDIIGKTMSQYVDNVYVKNGVLYVLLSSSVARKELSMNKTALIERLNSVTGHETIVDIVFR